MIKLQKIDDYTHRDGSTTKQIPHGNVWVRPELVSQIEQVNGVTEVIVAISDWGRGYKYTSHKVSETPEQIVEMMKNQAP